MCSIVTYVDISTPKTDCVYGAVRLVGGSNSTIGRLEICINNAWGTVCNSRFGTNEALVVCRQLGFSSAGECVNNNTPQIASKNVMFFLLPGGIAITRNVSSFGAPPNPIFIDNLACVGSESSILDCPSSALGFHQCGHSQDAGVQCFGIWE